MLKLLAGAVIGFAAAWFMDSKEGENRRTLVKDKATEAKDKTAEAAGKAKEKAGSGDSDAGSDESYVQAKVEDARDAVDTETVSRP